MAVSKEILRDAEERVVSLLREESAPFAPQYVIDELKPIYSSDLPIRAAIWRLIDFGVIELTWERQLRLLDPEQQWNQTPRQQAAGG